MVHKPTYEELEKRVSELEQQVGLQQVEGLHNSSEILSILFEAFKYIPQCKTFEDAATKIFEHCKKLTGALSGYVALLSETGEENEVLFLDAGGLPCDVDPNLPMPIRGLREVAYTTKSVAYDNAFAESPWMDFMPEGHVRLENVLFAPINIEDKTFGIIGIANKPGGFNEYDVYVAKILGDLAAVALTYANAQDSRKASEEHYRTLFDTINDSIFLHKILPNGEPGKFLQVNEAAATTLGYSIEELMSLSPRDLGDPATSQQYIPKVIELLRKSGNARFEAKQIAKDGSPVDVEVNAALTNTGGEEVIFSVCRDITERKKYQDYLEKYKNIVSSTLDGIAFLDENYRYIIVNDAYEKFSGVNREEFLGMTVSEYLGRDIFEKRIKPNFDTCLQGEVINYQDWFEYPKLGRRYVDVTYYPYRKSDGMIVGVVSNTRDITDRKEVEDRYARIKREFTDIAENIPGMVFQYVLHSDGSISIPYVSSKIYHYTGYSPDEIYADPSLFFQPIFTEDRERVNEAIHISAKNLSEFSVVHRLVNLEGELLWFQVKSKPVKTEDGDVIWNGVSIDISDRKQVEDDLRNSEELFRKTFDHAAVGIARIQPDGKFIKVNSKFAEITGFSQKELSTMSFDTITHPDDLGKENEIINRVVNGEIDSFELEKRYIHKNGHKIWIELYSNVVRDEKGNIKYAVASVINITDRKEYEKELKSLVHDQSVILNNIRSYIYFKDTENKILRISQAVADVTGLPKEQIEGVHSREIYPDMADDYWKDDLEVIYSGKPKLGIVEPLPLNNGQKRWLLTDKIPYFDEGGNVSGVIVMANDITDRIIYEEQLKANETKLNTIFQNNPAGIVISTLDEGRIIDCNESLEAITGYSKVELIGKKTVDTSFWAGGEKQREKTVDLLRSDGSFKNININFKTKSNEDRHGIFSAELVTLDSQDCIVTTMFDVTDLVKTKKELSESQEHYKILFERSHNAIFVVDLTTGRYLEANRAAEVLTGRSRDEIVKLTTEDITPKDAQNRLDKANQLKTTPDQVYEFKNVIYVRPDGSERAAVLTVVSGDGNQAFGIAQDITDQLKSEEQLRKAQRMESIGDLAGGIAHDFNNILAPIIGIAEMLIEDFPPGSPESENARQILKAGKRGSDLVKQILAFSRQSEHKMIPIRIQHILKEVLKLSRSTIPSYFEITQDIQPDCGMILGDPSQIHQVVMNVITNAFHAIEDTGGSISVKLSQKVLLGEEIGDVNPGPRAYAVIHISDTGHGMREELIGKIFDPYFTTKEQGKGTGLGLAVVYGIVKEHGGGIKVASEIGKGSVFEIYLPLMEELRLSESSKGSEEIQGGNERILLVDDEESIANLQQRMLERLGYKATSRISSIEALELFRAKPHSFDLVISDLSMPHMPGDLFSAELRAIRPGIPIIICTGFSERVREDTIQKMGINGLLMKPILKSELAKIVRKVLDEAR
jgi:PAS domain S-box-containing protein